MSFKIGSLFDGSGGFPLAATLSGGVPVWASEIEPYPIAVTRSRFPHMKHLGSVTDVRGNEIEPVDVITFGSPCQDLSVAGKRAGLKHEDNGDDETTRSGLFMEAVRIIKEMREATNGEYPRFALWENVPGAFSSNKGEDFRIVLEELIKITEPTAVMPSVPAKGWAYADCYRGDGWSIAYRVFDAQYWGVPQRRKRIYLVADFRGKRAGEILFKREGLRWYFAESGETRENATGGIKTCTGTGSPESKLIIDALPFDTTQITSPQNGNNPKWEDHCHPLAAGMHPPSVICKCYDARGNGDGAVVPTITGDHNNRITDYTAAVCLEGNGSRPSHLGNGYIESDIMYTLNATEKHGVAYSAYMWDYIVRRLTPTECARLQGFPDRWGHPDIKDGLTDEEYEFWLTARNTHAAINEKQTKEYTKDKMLTWYNKLHTDSAEYKMYGNGIALPCALYVMQGIGDVLCQR